MVQIFNRIEIRTGGMILTVLFFLFPDYIHSQEINTRALFNVPKQTVTDYTNPPTVAAVVTVAGNHRNDYTKNTFSDMDTSAMIWMIQKALYDSTGIILFSEEELPPADMPDSVYIYRLSAMPSIISLPYNSIVKNFIVYYMQKHQRYTRILLGLAEYYLPVFEQILDLYNIPLEMKALPVIESALNPVAVSRAGATGMWQFMLATGRRYDLTINTYVDERRDPIASTYAAAKYLNALYAMFQDWTLALAAYNCGEGNVVKAIARAGGKKDYWEIYPYLPKETRNYVPLFVAANYAVTYYREHRLIPEPADIPLSIDTFMVNSKLHFEQIASTVNIPITTLRNLNPQYRRDVIPGNERPYELRIPAEYTAAFIENERRIYGYNETKYFNPDIVVNPTTVTKNNNNTPNKTVNISSASLPATHLVQSGESLSIIASKYKIKLSSLYSWNNLTENSKIYPGQKLVIHAKALPPKTEADKDAKPLPKEKFHIVELGDSFWSITQKYNVDMDSLLKINSMTRNNKLLPGKKLLLP
jgi:membrane-bound lytic murein transglycosylase D